MNQSAPVYYVGDIHGRADLLRRILGFVGEDAARRGAKPVVHFLGDVVDRGPESCGAMELVHDTLLNLEGSALHLGNHDLWFLQALESRGKFKDAESWALHGGWNTIMSYMPVTDLEKLFSYIEDVYPHHAEMLRSARRFSHNGPFFAVHAGVDPNVSLAEQKARSYEYDPMLWIRDPFLTNIDSAAMPIIHGHTIMGKLPTVTENRISIDTGAYTTGRLTVCLVDPRERELRFWQTDTESRAVVEIMPNVVDRGMGTVYDRLPALFDTWAAAEAA